MTKNLYKSEKFAPFTKSRNNPRNDKIVCLNVSIVDNSYFKNNSRKVLLNKLYKKLLAGWEVK